MTTRLHHNRGLPASILPLALRVLSVVLLLLLLPPTGGHASNLPPEILKDKYEIIVGRHMATRSYERASHYMDRLAHLRDEFGVELEEGFDFRRANIHYQLGQYEKAARYLTDYLAATGKSGQFYEEALALLVDAEAASEAISARQKSATDRAIAAEKARMNTSKVVSEAARTQAAMERAARQNQLRAMAREAARAQSAASAAQPPEKETVPAPDLGLMARQKGLGQQFSALVSGFRFDAEAQAVDGNPARRYVFRLQANIDQVAKAGPGPCELSFSTKGSYVVERTGLTHAGTRENDSERVAQARVGSEVVGMKAADLRFNSTDQLHKAFNVYTFTAGDAQKITIYGAGGYMLRLYDVATAWGKACAVQ